MAKSAGFNLSLRDERSEAEAVVISSPPLSSASMRRGPLCGPKRTLLKAENASTSEPSSRVDR